MFPRSRVVGLWGLRVKVPRVSVCALTSPRRRPRMLKTQRPRRDGAKGVQEGVLTSVWPFEKSHVPVSRASSFTGRMVAGAVGTADMAAMLAAGDQGRAGRRWSWGDDRGARCVGDGRRRRRRGCVSRRIGGGTRRRARVGLRRDDIERGPTPHARQMVGWWFSTLSVSVWCVGTVGRR